MKVVAVFSKLVEVFVEVGDFDTWEEAAAATKKLPCPPPPSDMSLYLDRIWEDRGEEDRVYNGHEVVGVCALCGGGIADGCGTHGCDGKQNHDDRGGWVSTKHGHRIWCSNECREKDPEDPDRG